MAVTFCEANNTGIFWGNDGINRCYYETASSVSQIVFCLLAWTFSQYSYTKSHIRLNHLPKNFLFRFQLSWNCVLFALAIAQFIVQFTLTTEWYGYSILVFLTGVIVWPLSIWTIIVECHLAVNSSPTKRHSILLLLFWTIAFITQNLTFVSYDSSLWFFEGKNFIDHVQLGLFISRYISTFLIFSIGLYAPGIRESFSHSSLPFSINQRLINDEPDVEGVNNNPHSAAPAPQAGSFKKWWQQFKILLPYLWPKKALLLQFYVLLCVCFLIGGRIVNLFTPIMYKEIVNSLSVTDSTEKYIAFRWDLILIYGFLMLLQGGGGAGSMGLLNNLRTFFWTRVQQYTVRELQVLLFGHLHRLSLSWHLKRKTGEVLRAVDRGTNSVNNLLNYILFNILPTIADILIAVVYFVTAFNIWFGLIIFLTMIIYLGVTIWLTDWRTKYRRAMNKLDNAANARAVDSLLNFETVKYYGAENFEVDRYNEAILEYQEAEWKSTASAAVVNVSQSGIITTGLISSSLLCAYMVSAHKGLTSGDYVLLGTYILQLYMPLNWFGTYYRMIQQNFIDMENMFDLLAADLEVKDIEGAAPLHIKGGEIVFSDVNFHYAPERPILKGINFVVPPGKSTAIVGPTGSGKTTIVRLLFRFYDIQKGQILIDGQNISEVTQISLRKTIGVVPQDTVLFNNSIKYNIRYGRVNACDEEVETAAKAAEMHDQISVFPEGYETVVGERGLKLSGGEKQRVAIARTILKAPLIVLLDEATSALDTKTERHIQSSLAKICANRTSLVIAHRLSTIIDADEILVLKEGEIVERGTHEELLALEGLYDSMWKQQLEKSEQNGH